MRQYPRIVYKEGVKPLKVFSEPEEINAFIDGYEGHWIKEINEARKGTEKGILQGVETVIPEPEPVKEVEPPTVDPVTKDDIIPKKKRKRRTQAEIKAARQ